MGDSVREISLRLARLAAAGRIDPRAYAEGWRHMARVRAFALAREFALGRDLKGDLDAAETEKGEGDG